MHTNTNLSQAVIDMLDSEEAAAFYSELKAEGYTLLISKKEYAAIAGCSISTIDTHIKNGYGIPNYKKMGNAKNAKVIFSLIDVANYFSSITIKTA